MKCTLESKTRLTTYYASESSGTGAEGELYIPSEKANESSTGTYGFTSLYL